MTDVIKSAYLQTTEALADEYQRGVRQGRMMSRIERCVCTLTENGDGPIDVCEMHKAWAANKVSAEREACAVLAEHGGISADGDVGRQIAALIRTRNKMHRDQ